MDAAKACGSNPPDLTAYPADFVVLSYYKIFGYPTGNGLVWTATCVAVSRFDDNRHVWAGLGALLIRKTAMQILRRKYFGGGTVEAVAADADFVHRRYAVQGEIRCCSAETFRFMIHCGAQAGCRRLRGWDPELSRTAGCQAWLPPHKSTWGLPCDFPAHALSSITSGVPKQ